MANEKRLIDANLFFSAVEFIKKHLIAGDSEFLQGYEAGLSGAVNAVNELPTVDAVEVVHGQWIHHEGYEECGECHAKAIFPPPCEYRKDSTNFVEVVRCKDCKHYVQFLQDKKECRCTIFSGCYDRPYPTEPDDFCSYGERREEE